MSYWLFLFLYDFIMDIFLSFYLYFLSYSRDSFNPTSFCPNVPFTESSSSTHICFSSSLSASTGLLCPTRLDDLFLFCFMWKPIGKLSYRAFFSILIDSSTCLYRTQQGKSWILKTVGRLTMVSILKFMPFIFIFWLTITARGD